MLFLCCCSCVVVLVLFWCCCSCAVVLVLLFLLTMGRQLSFFFFHNNAAYVSLKAISYTVGFVSRKRPFSTEAQIKLSYIVEKGLFRLNFFRLRIPPGGSSRKSRVFRLDPPVEKLSRKSLHVFFEPIASFIPPPNTLPHGQTTIHPYTL